MMQKTDFMNSKRSTAYCFVCNAVQSFTGLFTSGACLLELWGIYLEVRRYVAWHGSTLDRASPIHMYDNLYDLLDF